MPLRTITLPVNPGAALPAFPQHDVQDVLDYTVDCTAWLADGGFTLTSVDMFRSADASLSVTPASIVGTTLASVKISGGTPGTTAQIGFRLHLSSNDTVVFVFSLPVVDQGSALSPVGSYLTIAGAAINIGAVPIITP